MNEKPRKVAYGVGTLARLLPKYAALRKDSRSNEYILYHRNNGVRIASRTEDEVAAWKYPDKVFRSIAERARRGIKDG